MSMCNNCYHKIGTNFGCVNCEIAIRKRVENKSTSNKQAARIKELESVVAKLREVLKRTNKKLNKNGVRFTYAEKVLKETEGVVE